MDTISITAQIEIPLIIWNHINAEARRLHTHPDLVISEYARRTALDNIDQQERKKALKYNTPQELLNELSELQRIRNEEQLDAMINAFPKDKLIIE